jgi:hypothetical protein
MDSQQLVVPKNAEVKILVKPRLKSDVEGAVSGEQFGLFFDHTAASNDATGTGAVRARGIESSNNLAANDGDSTAEGEVFIGQPTAAPNSRIIGNDNEVVLSKITSITNGGPATGSVPGGVDQQIGSFTFAAAANANTKNGPNQATMNGIVFSVNATNVNLAYDGLKIYNKAAGSTQNATCTPWTTNGVQLTSGNVSGSILVKCSDLITGGIVNTAVDQGSSITLVLLANVTNTNTAASSGGSSILQVSLNEFTNITKKIFGTWPSRSHIEWQDRDAASSQTFRWIEYPDTAVNSTTYHG